MGRFPWFGAPWRWRSWTGFLGPNGAGKSTAFGSVPRLDSPDSGRVRVDGERYRSPYEPLRMVERCRLRDGCIRIGRCNPFVCLARSDRLLFSCVDEIPVMLGPAGCGELWFRWLLVGYVPAVGDRGCVVGRSARAVVGRGGEWSGREGIFLVRSFIRELAAKAGRVLVSSDLLSEMSLTADGPIVIGRGKLIVRCAPRPSS